MFSDRSVERCVHTFGGAQVIHPSAACPTDGLSYVVLSVVPISYDVDTSHAYPHNPDPKILSNPGAYG